MLDTVKNHPRVQKIKTHFKEHKEAYIVGISCLGVGIVSTLVATNKLNTDELDELGELVIAPETKQIMCWKPESVQNIIVTLEEKANLSKPVRLKGTDLIYSSQNEASRVHGIDPRNISRQLNGLQPDVNGYEFEWLPMADVPSR